jgi:transitional endoplasmic reticulum ATPase
MLYGDTFKRLGLKPPRGVLLFGPPGCSKTTLVKVIASVSGATFLSVNGAQIYSPFVGDSEKISKLIYCSRRFNVGMHA